MKHPSLGFNLITPPHKGLFLLLLLIRFSILSHSLCPQCLLNLLLFIALFQALPCWLLWWKPQTCSRLCLSNRGFPRKVHFHSVSLPHYIVSSPIFCSSLPRYIFLQEIAQAHKKMEANTNIGKIVLKMWLRFRYIKINFKCTISYGRCKLN